MQGKISKKSLKLKSWAPGSKKYKEDNTQNNIKNNTTGKSKIEPEIKMTKNREHPKILPNNADRPQQTNLTANTQFSEQIIQFDQSFSFDREINTPNKDSEAINPRDIHSDSNFVEIKGNILSEFIALQKRIQENFHEENEAEEKEALLNSLKFHHHKSIIEIEKLGTLISHKNLKLKEFEREKLSKTGQTPNIIHNVAIQTDPIIILTRGFKQPKSTIMEFSPEEYYNEMLENSENFIRNVEDLSEIQMQELFMYIKLRIGKMRKDLFDTQIYEKFKLERKKGKNIVEEIILDKLNDRERNALLLKYIKKYEEEKLSNTKLTKLRMDPEVQVAENRNKNDDPLITQKSVRKVYIYI